MRIISLILTTAFIFSVGCEKVANTITESGHPSLMPEFEAVLRAVDETLKKDSPKVSGKRVSQSEAVADLQTIRMQVAEGQFSQVDLALDRLLADNVHSDDGTFCYAAFVESLVSAPGVEAWDTGSIHDHVVGGFVEVDKAWAARGSGFAPTVSDEGWKGFEEHLDLAALEHQKGLSVDGSNPGLFELWANIALGRGLDEVDVEAVSHPRTLAVCNRVLAKVESEWPGSDRGVAELCRRLFSSGNSELGIKILEAALQKYPDSSRLLTEKGRYEWRIKKHREAISFLQKSLKRDPLNPTTQHALSCVHHLIGDEKQAREHGFAALDLLNRDLLSKRGSIYYNIGISYRAGGDVEASIPHFKAAVTHKADGQRLYFYGEALYRSQRKEEAKEVLKIVIQTDPEYAKWVRREMPDLGF